MMYLSENLSLVSGRVIQMGKRGYAIECWPYFPANPGRIQQQIWGLWGMTNNDEMLIREHRTEPIEMGTQTESPT